MNQLDEFMRLIGSPTGPVGRGTKEVRKFATLSDTMKASIFSDMKIRADRYSTPCVFKVGDIVTPEANSTYANNGEPHIVIEVLEEPIRVLASRTPEDTAGFLFGALLDMRVAVAACDGASFQLIEYTVASPSFDHWSPRD